MTSPFKFLDPYGPEDIKAFFGREKETQELYSLVTKNRLTFVYGPSGSGKTSLVRCGLANRFKGIDWLPLFIRRGENINRSLQEAISKTLGLESAFKGDLAEAIYTLYNRFLRPIYLVFDQFEELYILGNREENKERQPFYRTIANLLERELPCRFLFIMREDYFGHLSEFEQLIPELYHRKLRVEPMSRENLHKVIVGSCEAYNIPFGEPGKDPDRILNNLLFERSVVQMPFVQVYLHKLYTKAAHQQKTGSNEKTLVSFSQDIIDHMGPIENVLGFFLEDQEMIILKELQALHPPEDLIRRVLNVFVSDEGTKIPVSFDQDSSDNLILRGRVAERLALLDNQLVSACLHALERNRILRRTEDQLEVAHDILAALIDRQRSDEQRQLNEIRRRIEIGYQEHVDSQGNYYFDRGQLSRIEPYQDQIAMPPKWSDFLDASLQKCEARENAEKIRAQRELELAEEKLAAEQATREIEQKASRRQKSLTRTAVGVALLAGIAFLIAFARNAEVQRQKSEVQQTLCSAWHEQLQRKQLEINQARLNLDAFTQVQESFYEKAARDSIQKLEQEILSLNQNLATCE